MLCYKSETLQDVVKVCRDLDICVVGFTSLGQGLVTDGMTEEKKSRVWMHSRPFDILKFKAQMNVFCHAFWDYHGCMSHIRRAWIWHFIRSREDCLEHVLVIQGNHVP
jgi:hypothetical protein